MDRHAARHLPAKVAKAVEARERKEGESTLDRLLELQERAIGLLDRAEARGSFVAATAAIGEARQCLAFSAKLTGELNDRPQVNVLVASPEWASLQARIVEALRPYPEALEAVKDALSERPTSLIA